MRTPIAIVGGMRQEEIWDVHAAQCYDTPGTGTFAPEVLGPTVDRLAELAEDGQALEFATEQVACLRNAARHLTPGGRSVVELWVPELRKLPPGQQATVWHSEPGYIGLDTYDVLRQRRSAPARRIAPFHVR